MELPLEITWRGVEKSAAMEDHIRQKVQKLERYCDHINSCRIALEEQNHLESGGGKYAVRIDLTVRPGHEIAVRKDFRSTNQNDDLNAILAKSFHAAEQQLKELVDRQHGQVKRHSWESSPQEKPNA